MISVYIVILNFNGFQDTIDCLKSLQKLTIKNFKLRVLIIDNNSSNDSVLKIKTEISKCNIQNTTYDMHVNEVNEGFAEGNNIGIRKALKNKADHILLLNNDTTVDKDLVVSLLNTFKAHKKVGIVTPKIYFAKGFEFHKKYKKTDLGKVIWAAGGNMDWKNIYGTNRGVDEIDEGQYNDESEVDFASGACMMISSKALKKAGLFNKKYFLYLEDADLCMRVKKAGLKIIYTPKGVLWHKVSQSSGIGSDLNDYFTTRNRLLFGTKYAGSRAKFALFRESIKMGLTGRKWQKLGVRDFYLRKFQKGSWQ